MSRDKQIEEMTSDVCDALEFNFEDLVGVTSVNGKKTAENLFAKGYRKASDVADELINAALSKIQIMISAIKAQEESGNVTEFNGGAKTALETVFRDIAELKKKYESEGEG